MRQNKLLLAAGSLLLVAGCCASKSSDELTDVLNRRYLNRPVNEFFVQYGLPAGEFTLNNQTHVYRWASTQRYKLPAEARLTTYHLPEGDYEVVDTYNGAAATHYCELRIYTDAKDNIERFAVAVDSIGKCSASRCSELFSD